MMGLDLTRSSSSPLWRGSNLGVAGMVSRSVNGGSARKEQGVGLVVGITCANVETWLDPRDKPKNDGVCGQPRGKNEVQSKEQVTV